MDLIARRRSGATRRRSGRIRQALLLEPLEARHLLSVTISNPGFETPSQNGGYSYDPSGTSWTFAGNSGIEANGSAWARDRARGHSGRVSAKQRRGRFGHQRPDQPDPRLHDERQLRAVVRRLQRQSNNGVQQSVGVYLDGSLVGTFTPGSPNTWSAFGAELSIATAGNHTLAFQAVNSSGDQSVFLDNLSIGDYSLPTVATAAAATPNPLSGTTTSLSVLGASSLGQSALTYTWSVVGTPPAPVVFSPNGTNAAQNAKHSFTQSGQYTLQATIADPLGGSVTSSVTVNVDVGLGTPANLTALWNGNSVNLTWSSGWGPSRTTSTVARRAVGNRSRRSPPTSRPTPSSTTTSPPVSSISTRSRPSTARATKAPRAAKPRPSRPPTAPRTATTSPMVAATWPSIPPKRCSTRSTSRPATSRSSSRSTSTGRCSPSRSTWPR